MTTLDVGHFFNLAILTHFLSLNLTAVARGVCSGLLTSWRVNLRHSFSSSAAPNRFPLMTLLYFAPFISKSNQLPYTYWWKASSQRGVVTTMFHRRYRGGGLLVFCHIAWLLGLIDVSSNVESFKSGTTVQTTPALVLKLLVHTTKCPGQSSFSTYTHTHTSTPPLSPTETFPHCVRRGSPFISLLPVKISLSASPPC